jgi:rhomboid protease GluP
MTEFAPVSQNGYAALPEHGFAVYLAKMYVAKKGYRPGTVPEAKEFLDISDIVLTYADGVRFSIVCILDRSVNPDRKFLIPVDKVQQIGKACMKYAVSPARGVAPQIAIIFVEVGLTSSNQADRMRLRQLRKNAFGSGVIIQPWIIDPDGMEVWSALPWLGYVAGRGFFNKIMQQPRQSDDAIRQSLSRTLPKATTPYLTRAIVGVLIAIFIAEAVLSRRITTLFLDIDTPLLIIFGALNRAIILKTGEWFRVISAALLHGNLVHVLLNCLALYVAGTILETLVGRLWLAALFIVGAVSGALLSLALNPANTVVVGASGAIMGLLAAALCLSYRLPPGSIGRTQIQNNLMQFLIPALIPIAIFPAGGKIDFVSHFGGAISGALVGIWLLKTWPQNVERPKFQSLAVTINIAGVAMLLWAAFKAIELYPYYVALTQR